MYTCQVIEIRHELFKQYSYYGVITYVNIHIILDMPPRSRGFVNRLQQQAVLSTLLYLREDRDAVASVFFNYHVHDDKIRW